MDADLGRIEFSSATTRAEDPILARYASILAYALFVLLACPMAVAGLWIFDPKDAAVDLVGSAAIGAAMVMIVMVLSIYFGRSCGRVPLEVYSSGIRVNRRRYIFTERQARMVSVPFSEIRSITFVRNAKGPYLASFVIERRKGKPIHSGIRPVTEMKVIHDVVVRHLPTSVRYEDGPSVWDNDQVGTSIVRHVQRLDPKAAPPGTPGLDSGINRCPRCGAVVTWDISKSGWYCPQEANFVWRMPGDPHAEALGIGTP